jgi:hypothetical protein
MQGRASWFFLDRGAMSAWLWYDSWIGCTRPTAKQTLLQLHVQFSDCALTSSLLASIPADLSLYASQV